MYVPSLDQGWGRAMQTNMRAMTDGICRDDMTTPTAQLGKCMHAVSHSFRFVLSVFPNPHTQDDSTCQNGNRWTSFVHVSLAWVRCNLQVGGPCHALLSLHTSCKQVSTSETYLQSKYLALLRPSHSLFLVHPFSPLHRHTWRPSRSTAARQSMDRGA